MDLQAAADGEPLNPDDDAATIMRRDHQALRKAFVHYRELMKDAARERAPVAQDAAMQLEIHFAITGEILYPALSTQAASLIAELRQAQHDLAECTATLRSKRNDGDEVDSTMVRLMELADIYLCKERELLKIAEEYPDALRPLGKRMLVRRNEIAGSVDDLESRS